GYQIVAAQESEKLALIVDSASLAGARAQALPNSSEQGFSSFEFGGKAYLSRLFDKDRQPVIVREWSKVMGLPTSAEISGLCKAVQKLRKDFPKADVGRALYLSSLGECLPVVETSKQQDLHSLAIEVLVGGAPISELDVIAIRAVNSWLLPEEIEAFLAAL